LWDWTAKRVLLSPKKRKVEQTFVSLLSLLVNMSSVKLEPVWCDTQTQQMIKVHWGVLFDRRWWVCILMDASNEQLIDTKSLRE